VNASARKTALSLSIALIIAMLVPGFVPAKQLAHADGLFMEQFNANLEGREVRLSVNVNPPVLTSETRQDAYVQFRLFDEATNATIRYSTFAITIEKGVGRDAERLLADVFHTESGLLTLKMQPQEGPVTILGTQEQFLNAWVADPGGTINVRGPIFLEGGLYHFRIEILGIDSIRELFRPDEVQKFDSWLSVGDVFTENVEYDGESYGTTIISYYDRVEEFDFNSSEKTFTWSMPFDWNTSRIDQTTIFVHEEVKIPKSMAGIGDSLAFAASVNDTPLKGARLVIDPYTSQSDLVLHYLLNKPDILSIAEGVPDGTEQMTFALKPSAAVQEETTTEMSTDTGGIHVALNWEPNPLDANAESIVSVRFSDAFSGESLDNMDVQYDIRILDSIDGTLVYESSGNTAVNGADTQTIDFPANELYRIEIQVQGISEDGRPADMTRNGVARGIVVVPEFPAVLIIAIAGVTVSVLLSRKFVRNHSRGLANGLP
jgi:hypothetical protein